MSDDELDDEVNEEAETDDEMDNKAVKDMHGTHGGGARILAAVLVAFGLLTLAFVPIYNAAILPDLKKLGDDADTYKNVYHYDGEMDLLNPSTMQTIHYPNATGKKFQQLNSSTDEYLYMYGNVSVYDQNGNFITILSQSESTIDRENYKELFNGSERDRWFTPNNVEKKTYHFPNPFVGTHLDTLHFQSEEKKGGLNCYKFHSLEKGIYYKKGPNNWNMTLDYDETVWIYPPTGTTVDQYYNITVWLHIPNNIADLPVDYSSYANYTGTYTVADPATLVPTTINASGVRYLEAVSVDGLAMNLQGNLSLYNRDSGDFIEVMAQINRTINRHSHYFMKDGTDMKVTYTEANYTAENPMIPGLMNDYIYVNTEDILGLQTYHYRAEALSIPYDQEMPAGLPPGTHMYLNYIEDIWIDPKTGVTIDQDFNVTASLSFPDDLTDIPEEYSSYTNYTGTYTVLDPATMQVSSSPATGTLHLVSQGVDDGNINLQGNLTLYPDGGEPQVLAHINRTVNMHTHNAIKDGQEVVIDYTAGNYTAENPLVPGYMNHYTLVGVESVGQVQTNHYTCTEIHVPYDAGLPAGLPPGTHLYLLYQEDIWIDPVTGTTIDQDLNITGTLEFPLDMADLPLDYENYINYTGSISMLNMTTFAMENYTDAALVLNAKSLGLVSGSDTTLKLNVNLTAYNGSQKVDDIITDMEKLINKRTHNYVNATTGADIPPPAYAQADYQAENPIKANGWMTNYTYLRTEDNHGVVCNVYEANDTIPYNEGLPQGMTQTMYYHEIIWADPVTKLTIDQVLNITTVIHYMGNNYTALVVDVRYDEATILATLALRTQIMSANAIAQMGYKATAMVIVAHFDTDTVNATTATALAAQGAMALMAAPVPVKVIVAGYDNETVAGAVADSMALARAMALAGNNITALHILAGYSTDQVKSSADDAIELDNKLNFVNVQIPTYLMLAGILIMLVGAVVWVFVRKK